MDAVIVARLDRLTRRVKGLAELLERFTRCGVRQRPERTQKE